jgi:hypothetical protein
MLDGEGMIGPLKGQSHEKVDELWIWALVHILLIKTSPYLD